MEIDYSEKQPDHKNLYKLLVSLNKKNGGMIKKFIKQYGKKVKHKKTISHNLSTV